jgi:hypothetical protein
MGLEILKVERAARQLRKSLLRLPCPENLP